MSKFMKFAIGVIIIFIIIGIPTIMMTSSYNQMVAIEEQLDAKHLDTKNVYASIFNNLKSQGKSVEAYKDAVIEALNVAIGKRYGEGGAKSAMLWLKEHNPNIDSQVYLKLQQIIEASYLKFEVAQRAKLDIVREYKTFLRVFPNNIFASILGFPKKDLDEIGKIVTNKATTKVFESGEAEAIDPFK